MPGTPFPRESRRTIISHICNEIILGRTVERICEDPEMPSFSVYYSWLREDPELAEMVRQARIHQADTFADRIVDLAEKAIRNPRAARAYDVAIRALQWQAAMRSPRVFGDFSRTEHKIERADTPADILKERAELEGRLGITFSKVTTITSSPLPFAEAIDEQANDD